MIKWLSILGLFCVYTGLSAQAAHKKGEFYFSWGYNKVWYTKSDVHINQPSLGNHYTFQNITGHDKPGWNEDFFNKELTIPQYNYRLGYIINPRSGWGIEINFDHTKFIFDEQETRIKGSLQNRNVDTLLQFNKANGFYYFLNNGANFLLFNIVKRHHFIKTDDKKFLFSGYAKAGLGPVIPHVENSFFGQKNKPQFQFGGWNAGLEYTLRATAFRFVYLEYAGKLDYAAYSGLKIYEGTAKQSFSSFQMILSLGLHFGLVK